jgi:hypothetical protein
VSRLDELDLFCCQNPDCEDYGLRGQGSVYRVLKEARAL